MAAEVLDFLRDRATDGPYGFRLRPSTGGMFVNCRAESHVVDALVDQWHRAMLCISAREFYAQGQLTFPELNQALDSILGLDSNQQPSGCLREADDTSSAHTEHDQESAQTS